MFLAGRSVTFGSLAVHRLARPLSGDGKIQTARYQPARTCGGSVRNGT